MPYAPYSSPLPPMRKKITILTLTLLMIVKFSYGQMEKEYLTHIESIDNTYFPTNVIDQPDSIYNANKALVDYVVENHLSTPADRFFISDRRLLPKLGGYDCNSQRFELNDTLISGNSISIMIAVESVEKIDSILNKGVDSLPYKTSDLHYPFQDYHGDSAMLITKFEILVNNQQVQIPHSAYSRLVDLNICDKYVFHRPIEVYESINGDYFYIYLYGPMDPAVWFTKLIFDYENYLTQIFIDYATLSQFSSFRESFIGY
jgi:hypothetical protein